MGQGRKGCAVLGSGIRGRRALRIGGQPEKADRCSHRVEGGTKRPRSHLDRQGNPLLCSSCVVGGTHTACHPLGPCSCQPDLLPPVAAGGDPDIAAYAQGEPEFERLKRELDEVKLAHQRSLDGVFRSTAEMDRHRAQLADAAIEEQLEVQTAFREQGVRLQGIYDKKQRAELDMSKR